MIYRSYTRIANPFNLQRTDNLSTKEDKTAYPSLSIILRFHVHMLYHTMYMYKYMYMYMYMYKLTRHLKV